jgi:hypothetical protein
MALLEDPTIQRILDEVNKAASGGVLGLAGKYIPPPVNTRAAYPSNKDDFFHQQQPLFYPSNDMFNINSMNNFDGNIDLTSMESMVPVVTPNNFDHYSSGLYNTMPNNVMSPYENYKHDVFQSTHQPQTTTTTTTSTTARPMRTISIVSSTNNDILSEHHRHHEYPTIPPNLNTISPNLVSNLRVTSPMPTATTAAQMDMPPADLVETDDVNIGNESMAHRTTDTGTASIDLIADKDDQHSIGPNEADDIEPSHLGRQSLFDSVFLLSISCRLVYFPASAGRIFYDPNPQIIQRKGSNSVTYKQNIIVRFLQPPPIPNAGPLIIKEVIRLSCKDTIGLRSFVRSFVRCHR